MRLTLIVIGALMASLIFPIAAIASETAQPEAQPATSEAAPQTPPAEPLLPQELAQRVNRLVSDVESAAKAIDRVKDRDSGLAEQRGQLERLEVEAEQLVEELVGRGCARSAPNCSSLAPLLPRTRLRKLRPLLMNVFA